MERSEYPLALSLFPHWASGNECRKGDHREPRIDRENAMSTRHCFSEEQKSP